MNDQLLLSTIATRLRDMRCARGLTQAELAARCGTTPQMVSNVERGKNWLSVPQLFAFAEGLGVSPGYFFPDLPAQGMRSQLQLMVDSLALHELEAATAIIKTLFDMRKKGEGIK
ncbi:MAG: helix-turn-helix domain-containing protein [Solirubrobacterales bacterium]